MRLAVNIVWLILVVLVLILLAQTLGSYDVPGLRDLRALLPLGQAVPVAAVATPSVPTPSPTVTVRPVAAPSAAPKPTVAADVCGSSALRFLNGAAALKAALGADMGDPTECERVVDAAGNTEQKTTTGLTYYRAASNLPVFTNGFDHWALTPGGVVHWTGDDLEPPPDTEPDQ